MRRMRREIARRRNDVPGRGLPPAVGFKFVRQVDSVLMQRALAGAAADLPGGEIALPGGDPGRAG